jgi:hypothetical protein
MGSVTAAAAPRELGRALGLPHPVGRRGLGGRAPVLGRGREAVRDVVGRVWPYVVGGIAVGAGIHGYVPQDFMVSFMGREA